MLLLDNIEHGINELLSLFIEHLGGVVAVWQNNSYQAIASLDL